MAAALLTYGRSAGLTAADMGLARRDAPRGLALGAVAGGVVIASLAAALLTPAAAPLLRDQRIAGLDAQALAAWTLVRIPLGTVLLEEVAFRGVLYGLLTRNGSTARAVAGSSAVFGVWHVVPTWLALQANVAAASPLTTAATIGGSVLATAGAGAAFCALRLRSGSLVAPMLAHVATNAGAAIAAYIALGRAA